MVTSAKHNANGRTVAALRRIARASPPAIAADHDNCLEVFVVKGKAANVQKIADALISTRGVKHCRPTLTAAGTEI